MSNPATYNYAPLRDLKQRVLGIVDTTRDREPLTVAALRQAQVNAATDSRVELADALGDLIQRLDDAEELWLRLRVLWEAADRLREGRITGQQYATAVSRFRDERIVANG
jgi:hypothetical protein